MCTIIPHDTVIDELTELAAKQDIESEDLAIAMAAYVLEFGSYKDFRISRNNKLFYKGIEL